MYFASEKPQKANKDKSFDDFVAEANSANHISKPNSGFDSNAVESLVFGKGEAQSPDELLAEMSALCASPLRAQSAPYIINDFSSLPEKYVYSEFSSYRMIKRSSRREFYITGKALESRIGLDSALYEKVKARSLPAFCLGDFVVAFDCAKIPAKPDTL